MQPRLFPEYQLRTRTAREHLRLARWLGILAVVLTVILIFSSASATTANLWCYLGIFVGLELILWGAYAIRYTTDQRTSLGDRLADSAETWFPPALFVIKHAFIIALFIMLWSVLADQGFPSGAFLDTCFVLLLVVVPCRKLLQDVSRVYPSPRTHGWSDFLNYTTTVLVTLFTAALLTWLILPKDGPPVTGLPPVMYFIWIPAVLICVACAILLVDRLVRGKSRWDA